MNPSIRYPLSDTTIQILKEKIVDTLKGIYDPEIPVNIYDLGLIYDVSLDAHGAAKIAMTLTSPGCPVAQTFPGTVENAVNQVDGISETVVELVWDPPWTMDNMSEVAKLQLGVVQDSVHQSPGDI